MLYIDSVQHLSCSFAMQRYLLLLTFVSAAVLVACDSSVIDEPESGQPTEEAHPLKMLGHEGAWQTPGDGHWREALDFPFWNDSVKTDLRAVRTESARIAFQDSFHFHADLLKGGQNGSTNLWHESKEALSISGSYVRAGRFLVLEPTACDPTKGPVMGIVSDGFVNLYAPGRAAWNHSDITWMRFATTEQPVSDPQLLPAGSYPVSTFATTDAPCSWKDFPYALTINSSQIDRVTGITVRVFGNTIMLDQDWDRFIFRGEPTPFKRSTQISYVREGNLVMGALSSTVPGTLDTTERVMGIIEGDTLRLQGLLPASQANLYFVVKAALR